MEFSEVEKLGHWVLKKKFKVFDTSEYLSEMYLCYDKCRHTYKPEYSNFATYFRTCFEGWMKDYFTYNDGLVHVPKKKQDTHAISVSSLSAPLSDDGTSVCAIDLLEGAQEPYDAEEKETAMWLSRIDDLWPRLRPKEREAIPYFKAYILEEKSIPREYHTHIWRIRKMLLESIEK